MSDITVTGVPIPDSISRADLIARANKLSSETLPYDTDLKHSNKEFIDTVDHYYGATVGELLTNVNAIVASARRSEFIDALMMFGGAAAVGLAGPALLAALPMEAVGVGAILLGMVGVIAGAVKGDAAAEAEEQASVFGQHVADLAIFMGSEQAKPAQAQPPSDAPIMYSVGMRNGVAC